MSNKKTVRSSRHKGDVVSVRVELGVSKMLGELVDEANARKESHQPRVSKSDVVRAIIVKTLQDKPTWLSGL